MITAGVWEITTPEEIVAKELAMGHAIRIKSNEQYVDAIRVLNKMPGMWRGIGPSSAPVILVTETQYKALVEAGVVPRKGEAKANGKKAPAKKSKS